MATNQVAELQAVMACAIVLKIKFAKLSCYICRSEIRPVTCKSCSTTQYRNTAHQSLDCERHLPDCTRIQEAINSVSIAEERLLERYFTLPNLVDTACSNSRRIIFMFTVWPSHPPFLGIIELQESYINALRILISTYLEIGTYLSLQRAYERVKEFHRLALSFPGQSTGTPLEYTIPTLLYMKEDQICYTYLCSRWSRRDRETLLAEPEARTDFEALERLWDPKKFKKDVFDGLKRGVDATDGIRDVFSQGTMVLLYFWWISDLKNLQLIKSMESWLVRRMNFDIYTIIRSYMTETNVIQDQRDLLKANNTALMEKMERRMRYHFRCGHYMNGTFWEQMIEISEDDMVHSLVDNARVDNKGRGRLTPGRQEDDRKILNLLYWPFKNTPGAFEYVEKMIPEIESSLSCEDDEEEDNSFP
ncbi:hypothetical protein TWF102_006737 [Orbilia oligospora]|uniref:Uncharacterized protein n=1 Tax=Orbilia oligospora TaxID=2813651 RepID=A0A7C8NC45_ORBOL|nr:hypothetical protein TWF102_006737 [Orbilia oligospora]KAF3117150.1 hypothetical protein TWF103_007303 [Orbilia oligospora]